MRDSSLLIAIIGAILVSTCSSSPQRNREDEPVRMASESLVVKSYKEAESSTASTTKSHGERFEEYQVYQGVMGRPGIDFPVYPHIPATSFSCRGVKKSGYYADLETDCQVFHICDGNRKISFLCPNGTIFRQSHLICDWWFRVDCGKSVELYEESAEQLAADQKIYRARSEERERRRKLGKTAIESGGEVISSEVFALDEPFHLKGRKPNQQPPRTPQRNSFEGRKGERHSKKVVDSGATEKFPNYNKQNVRVTERVRTTAGASTPTVSQSTKSSFVDTPVTPSTYKVRYQTPNSINYQNNKENIQPAESGSLVEDLNNRKSTFGFNNASHQSFEYNSRGNVVFNQKTETSNFQTDSFAYTESPTFDDNSNRNINFNYNDNKQTTRNNKFSFNGKGTQQYNFGADSNSKKSEDTTDNGPTAYTTEYFGYESKRTNPAERQETVAPTFQTTRNSQSSRYRNPTPQQDKFYTETASVNNNRGGKSFSDFQNQFFQSFDSTTANPHRTTFYTTSKRGEAYSTTPPPPPVPYKYSTVNFNQEFYRTTTHRPVKQHSRKVTVYPSTIPQTTFVNRNWQTTTFQPETTTNEKFTVDDVYFTTSTPEKEVGFKTETQFDVSHVPHVPQKLTEVQSESASGYTTSKSDVDISLREVNINKTPQPTINSNKTYEDFAREGLEVPPSSGPNAIRSFALYFATTNNDLEESKTTVYLPTNEPDVGTTLTPFEIKKKEVLKQVDELVQKSAVNTSDHVSRSEDLPNSLTLQIQNSYSELFPPHTENHTSVSETESFETTAFESFTEEPFKINKELTKNDLDGSQSRGLVEPDPHSDADYGKVSPDLRELAQVFTKALSAYLDDPEAFRRVLSEIRPTEPTVDSEVSSSNPLEYPSATQEDDEVLDFSDVTKSAYKKKTSTLPNFRDATTEYYTELPTTTNANEIENFVLPVNHSGWATNIELTAPLLESLDQSQSSYYTAPPYIGTTNAIAEEINNEFTGRDQQSEDQKDTVDSYLPIKGSVDDPSLPRYGGFQNNTKTTKYSPYGSELTSTTYLPYGADLTSTATPNTAATTTVGITTFNPKNSSSFFSHFTSNETEEGEIQLAKELNNLVLLQKFTTPRGTPRETTTTTTAEPNLSTLHQNDITHYQDVKLGNGEILEKSARGGKSLHLPEATISSNHFEPDAKEINLELSPPPSTPKGFLITYSLGGSSRSEPATYLPKATTPVVVVTPTTYSPGRQTYYTFLPETQPPTTDPEFENYSERLERLTKSRSTTEYYTTPPATTISFSKSTKSIDRITQLQETLMFNTSNLTHQQRDQARVSVEEMIDKMNMTDSTANTLMRVMEMAAKNETYRRLVLLLVNDKSGKNKTVEESRLSLLKALLTPVINPPRTDLPIREASKVSQPESRRRSSSRRSKSINSDSAANTVGTTLPPTTRKPTGRKPNRGLTRAESNYQSGLGNLGVIRRTIENSKNKQVRINSIDDAILDSDSRAVELLRSLYSLAARWG